MPMQKSKSTVKKSVVIKLCKSHRVFVLVVFSLLFLLMLAAAIYLHVLSEFGVVPMLLFIPLILFLQFPLFYATWQITFDAEGIQKRLCGINCKKHPWTQVKEVRSAWLVSERNYVISIIFKDKKSVRFRMDCENAEAAKKMILSHCSIAGHKGSV